MLRTMKRLMALSLGIAFPVETHLYFDGVAIVSHYSFNIFHFILDMRG
jgi:hypothetical protein